MILGCCVISAGAESDITLRYHENSGTFISIDGDYCKYIFSTACRPDLKAEQKRLIAAESRQDRIDVEMNLTVDEMESVSAWIDRHLLLEPSMADQVEKEPSTINSNDRTVITLTVARGADARYFRLDRDMEVSEVLRTAEADLQALCHRFYADRRDRPVVSPYASILTDAGAASCLKAAQPDPSCWKEPRLFHQPFDNAIADRISITKSEFPAAFLTPVHSPNKAYYFMTVRPDFTREGPWSTAVYIYVEKDQLTRIDLLDHSSLAPGIEWLNEKLLSIRVWWGRIMGTDLIIDVETGTIVSKEMVVDGRILYEQHAESQNALEKRRAELEENPDTEYSIVDLRRMLASGTPEEKEQALDSFNEHFQAKLVPNVIEAILDETRLPRQGDTGWGTVHHYAATAMCAFARRIDGLSQKERGRHEFSFYDEGGVATAGRRQEVHANWLAWWQKNGQGC